MQNNQTKMAHIREKLISALDSEAIQLFDESHLHQTHASFNPEKIHLALSARSAKFNNLSALARQRLVYKILTEEMNATIHALRFIELSSIDSAAHNK